MIRKITLFLTSMLLVCSFPVSASKYTYDIQGVTFQVDTLFHAQVGPGTTQTSLLLTGPSYNLRAFYVTIDIKNPRVSVRTVCGNDKVAGCETTSSMAKRKTTGDMHYFAGVNGDFFATSGTSNRGSSVVGTPTTSCIVDGEFYKTSNSNKQFAIDVNGIPFIGQMYYYDGTAVCGENKVLFKGVNVSSPNNGITVYTPRYYGGSNQTSTCAEVQAKLAEGEVFSPGKSCKMIVTSAPSTAGDTDVPSDGFVIHGRGTDATGGTMGAYDFVNGLKVGDEVTINSDVKIDGTNIIPQQVVSGNPRTVGDGATLDTEGERGDASSYHPRTGIGYGDNKSKVVMMVVDGRSSISNGVRTSQLGDLMRYAGATDAINLDGGGSSTLYTQALGTRNHPSDGNERADGNAIFAVCEAPTDDVVTEIRFKDWAMQFPQYGSYTPQFYGYNQYGMLVDTDVKGVTLSCDAALGHIKNDGTTFVGDGDGTYALVGTFNGMKASIPVTISEAKGVRMRLSEVINDTYREYPIEVEAQLNDDYMQLDPASLSWTTDDSSIASVDAGSGVLKGVANGTTIVRGTLNDFNGEMKVTVEKPSARTMAIDPTPDPATWTITQVGGANIAATALGDGLQLKYTGASGRGTYIKLAKTIKLWSIPDTLRLRIVGGAAPIKNVTFAVNSASGISVTQAVTPTFVEGKESIIDLPTAAWCDATDLSNYPISLSYIYLTMGTSTTGTEYTIDIPGIEAVYAAVPASGVTSAIVGKSGIKLLKNPIAAGENARVSVTAHSAVRVAIYNASGQKVKSVVVNAASGIAEVPTSELGQGIYLMSISDNNSNQVVKLIVK